MNVSDIMKKDVVCCHPSETLAVAAERMWNHDIGSLPVVNDEGHVIGMLTDRDICMAAYTQGKPLFAIPASVAMSRELHACLPSDAISAAEKTMRAHRVRRLPVIDRHGHPVGLISLNDLARNAEPGQATRKHLSAAEVAATLAAVCAPRPAIVAAVA
jgi:CBS domain-containing protein